MQIIYKLYFFFFVFKHLYCAITERDPYMSAFNSNTQMCGNTSSYSIAYDQTMGAQHTTGHGMWPSTNQIERKKKVADIGAFGQWDRL